MFLKSISTPSTSSISISTSSNSVFTTIVSRSRSSQLKRDVLKLLLTLLLDSILLLLIKPNLYYINILSSQYTKYQARSLTSNSKLQTYISIQYLRILFSRFFIRIQLSLFQLLTTTSSSTLSFTTAFSSTSTLTSSRTSISTLTFYYISIIKEAISRNVISIVVLGITI